MRQDDNKKINIRDLHMTTPSIDAPDHYAISEWKCPCGGFHIGPMTSTVPGTSVRIQCPWCGATAEISAVKT